MGTSPPSSQDQGRRNLCPDARHSFLLIPAAQQQNRQPLRWGENSKDQLRALGGTQSWPGSKLRDERLEEAALTPLLRDLLSSDSSPQSPELTPPQPLIKAPTSVQLCLGLCPAAPGTEDSEQAKIAGTLVTRLGTLAW